ncbi:AAA family ATPase [Enteractinococcus helveticum]|uniref:AAA domain-containing protein n=1 Tax=Enteractinococcus helveticum TaxID=1837282 RepID=A0A1B7M2H7_9MICC|nr:AAA family ATPase [Enteractinococcus helveticum]OAV62793.1 hypothetical protein A6F49_04615 [Enteractinococcus helveticum]
MSQNNQDRRVGLIEVPDLVPVLSDAGYEVVTGDTVADAVKAIQEAFTAGSFPIVVADSTTSGLHEWTAAVASMEAGPEVSVITTDDADTDGAAQHIVHDNIAEIPAPFTLAQLAEEAVLAPVDEQWAEVVWPQNDQETEIEQNQGVVPQLPGLPSFDQEPGDSPSDGAVHQGDTSGNPQVEEDTWDATAQHRRRLAERRAQMQHDQTADEPAPAPVEDRTQLPTPQQPVDYSQQSDETDVYNTGLNLSAQHQQPPPAQQLAESLPPRRANRRQAPSVPQPQQPHHGQPPQQGGPQWNQSHEQPPAPAKRPVPGMYGQRDIRNARVRTRQCPLIIFSGAKGGVGKTTLARQTAIHAASQGYRTVLIDGDIGQGNVAKFFRMDTSSYNVPTISDFAIGDASLEEIVLTSNVIDELRPDNSTPVPDLLSVVLAPEDDDQAVNDVTAHHYVELVADVRQRFDMVVLDSQIMKTTDEFKLTNTLIIPEVRDNGAYYVGIADSSNSALKDLVNRIRSMVQMGVDRRRILVTMNKVPPIKSATESIEKTLRHQIQSRVGIYVGVINEDQRVWRRNLAGEPDLMNTQFDQVIYNILFQVTGYEEFDKKFDTDILSSEDSSQQGRAEKKPGFFARLLGRG